MGYGLGLSLSFTINLVADGNTFPLSRQAGICVCKSITLVNIFGMSLFSAQPKSFLSLSSGV